MWIETALKELAYGRCCFVRCSGASGYIIVPNLQITCMVL